MKPIEEALRVLIGREPSAEDISKFYKIKEICNFSEHDSVWSLLLAFGHYEILYEEIPAKKLRSKHIVSLQNTRLPWSIRRKRQTAM
ncbi:hypothetical protein ACFS07_36690 [Undibacterium arcticum]